jgi:hypothetical protein
MNTDFFTYEKVKFVSLRDEYFNVGNIKFKTLKIYIQDIIPVRKYFNNGKLMCYSINSNSSNKGKTCALCSERFKCFMKVRIMMNIKNHKDKIIPAAIEVGKIDFDNLQKVTKNISVEELYSRTIKITANDDKNKKNKLDFSLEN